MKGFDIVVGVIFKYLLWPGLPDKDKATGVATSFLKIAFAFVLLDVVIDAYKYIKEKKLKKK